MHHVSGDRCAEQALAILRRKSHGILPADAAQAFLADDGTAGQIKLRAQKTLAVGNEIHIQLQHGVFAMDVGGEEGQADAVCRGVVSVEGKQIDGGYRQAFVLGIWR